MGAEGEHTAKLVPEFERRNPGISVKVQMIPWNAAHEKLLTAFAGRALPDMCQLGNTWIPEFRQLDALEDLDPWIAQSAVVRSSAYFPGVWESNVIDSAAYGVPWYVDTRLLFYRTDLLAAVGFQRAPRTWDEVREVGRRIRAAAPGGDRYAILLPVNNEWQPIVLFAMEGGSALLRDGDTRGDFGGPAFRRSLTEFREFFASGWAPRGTRQIINVYQQFAEGYFAMYITGPWNVAEFTRRLPAELQGSWATAPLPGRGDTVGVSLAGGSSLVMFRSSLRKPEVWKFVEYLSEPAVQLEFYRLTNDLPARTDAWADSMLAGNPRMRAFLTQLANVRVLPKVPEWEQIADRVRNTSEVVALDQMPLDDAVLALDREVDQILEKRRWMIHER
jgi:multiple sugar transport system substrate-binding protein